MKLAKATPFAVRMPEEIERVFDRFFGNRLYNEPLFGALPLAETPEMEWTPALDLTETDKEFIARIEVPGIPRENLDVKLVGDLLTISGKREKVHEAKGEIYVWKETAVGKFLRTIRLPAPVLEGKVEATYQEGVLTVHMPKVAPLAESKILIK
jgi:HSP20 family protein